MEIKQVFTWLVHPVTFKTEKGVTYVNATEMAQPFRKLVGNYLRNKSTIDYIQVVNNQRYSNLNNIDNQLVITIQGGDDFEGRGTWMQEDIALHFAQWLSPEFYLWCNDRIKELLKHGMTALPSTIDEMIESPDLIIQLATKLKEERAEKLRLSVITSEQKAALVIAAPKVTYFDKVLNSNGTWPISLIAKELGMEGKALNLKLKELGIQYKLGGKGGHWVLKLPYENKGYTKMDTYIQDNDYGGVTRMRMKWTQKGRNFIHSLLNPDMNPALQTENDN